MQKGDPLALCTKSGNFVDETDASRFAARQRTVDIINGETDVMDSRTASGDELANRGIGSPGFEEFDQGLSGCEAGDTRAIGVIERNIRHAEDVAVEWKDLIERTDGKADMGNAGTAWCGICHDGKNSSGAAVQAAAHDR